MAASALDTRSTAGPTVTPPASPKSVPEAVRRPRRRGWSLRRPSLAEVTALTTFLVAGIGALVWYFAGGGVDGAIVAGIVTVGLAVLVGSYASVFVTRGRR